MLKRRGKEGKGGKRNGKRVRGFQNDKHQVQRAPGKIRETHRKQTGRRGRWRLQRKGMENRGARAPEDRGSERGERGEVWGEVLGLKMLRGSGQPTLCEKWL
eukprot:6187746-Pleurochrysis_carterae.AAC.2